ncbi:hypothetical protein F4824DRAFT_428824 [Ustulina deusta]|nr:hypothetical protein F4824DRAFT_428824 [Ustulina deusta]
MDGCSAVSGVGNRSAVGARVVFTESKWVVSSQQPPTHQPGELRRVDLVVEEIDSHAQTAGTLLFVEAKRAGASPSDIMEVEYQAFTAACVYYVETGIERLWTMTCVGSRARLCQGIGIYTFVMG